MAQGLAYRVEDGVAILGVKTREGGALLPEVRAAVIAALAQAGADADVSAIVITGEGRGFPSGVDISELRDGARQPTLLQLCAQVAQSRKPVVAALRGLVRDGGAELALAARARVAVAGTWLQLSEIEFGLIPGGGATQRLPRLVGAGAALQVILSGRGMPVEAPRLAGLCARIIEKDVVGAACALAREIAAGQGPEAAGETAPGLADPMAFQAEVAAERAALARATPERRAAIDCVEAAQLLPLEAGLAFEAQALDELRSADRAAGLLHVAAAERTIAAAPAKVPGTVTVFGDGSGAMALVLGCVEAGLRVRIAERREGGAVKILHRISERFQQAVQQGRISGAAAREQLGRVGGGAAVDLLQAAEMVVEASSAPFDRMTGVADLLRGATGEGVPVVLTSGVGLGAGAMRGLLGGRVLGATLPGGVHGARLIEIARPGGGDGAALAAAAGLCRRIGKLPLVVGAENGLIVQRLAMALFAATEWCVAQGAGPEEVDAALGWRRGPFAMLDREGLAAQPERLAALGGDEAAGGLNAALLAAGRWGLAEGRGVYRYSGPAARGMRDPEAEAVIAAWRGGAARAIPAGAIRARVTAAVQTAGLGLLARGVAGSAGEIDLAAVLGLGWPRVSGGPMKAAEMAGLLQTEKQLHGFARDAAGLWQAGPVLAEAVRNGGRFSRV